VITVFGNKSHNEQNQGICGDNVEGCFTVCKFEVIQNHVVNVCTVWAEWIAVVLDANNKYSNGIENRDKQCGDDQQG
jgi:hypothetical protein